MERGIDPERVVPDPEREPVEVTEGPP